MSAANGRIAYRPEIDGLRAIAVLQVVLYHAGAGLGAGYVGVDVFFVISGYLITSLLLQEFRDTGRIDVTAFYARRVRRIFPAALLTVAATLVVGAALLSPQEFAHLARSAAAAAMFIANVFFQYASGGYFDAPSEAMPLLHLWSLAVEEQFYLVWPALLILLLRGSMRHLPWLLGLSALASFALAELLVAPRPEAAFYFAPARFWELAAGGLVACSAAGRGARPASAALGLLLVLAAAFVPLAHFPGAGALPSVAGAALLIAAVHGGDAGAVGRLLRTAPLTWIGKLSYPLYLWHWPLLAFYRATTLGDGATASRLLLCLLALALAWLTYRYVEQPLRTLANPRGRLLLAGAAASMLLAATAFAWNLQARREALGNDDPAARAAEVDRPSDGLRCHYQRGSSDFPRQNCESRPRVAPTIAIWGDSMALAWKPLAWRLARERQTSAIAWSRDSCPPVFDFRMENGKPPDAHCDDFVRYVAGEVKGMQTLILVMHMGSRAVAERVAGLAPTVDAVAPHVRRVIILGPTPQMLDSVPKCLRAGQPRGCAVSRAEFDAIAQPQLAQLHAIAARHRNVDVVELGDFFCTAQECPAVADGHALYWDEYHVSTSAVADFAERYVAERSEERR
jgi:peptidoglycan/LPS O-acetylase OafA/YrhL